MKFKKKAIIIFISIITISCSTDKKLSMDIEYDIQSNLKDSIPVVQVSFNYKSDSNGLITLRYENNSWGDNNIFNCINNLNVTPKPKNIEYLRDSSRIIIKTSPNINNTINYQIAQDYDGSPMNQKRYRPIIDSTYFHVLGMRLFITPEPIFESDTSKANIRINYLNNTNNGIFHSSFGKSTVQNIEVTREDLYASFFVGGDFRRYSFTHEKDSVFFVTRGNWKAFKDQDILNILKETIDSQRNFWNDPRKGPFSVSLIPTYEKWYSVGGSGFSSSFASFASNNDKITLSQMKWLYNHEFVHKWIGRTIINENEVEEYWFSEGFADYYTYKLLLKYNRLDITEYIDILNKEIIIPHYKDPVNNIPNAELTFEEYWSNYAKYMKLPYRRGLLYAFFIDNQIKKQSQYSQSLDDLMHDLFAMALENKNMRFNQTIFIQALSRYLNPVDLKSDFERYILEGKLIDFKNKLPNGISIDYSKDIPTFKIVTEDLVGLEKKLKQ